LKQDHEFLKLHLKRALERPLATLLADEPFLQEMEEQLSAHYSKEFHLAPHPRSRVYRAEPLLWKIEDVQAEVVIARILKLQSSHKKSSPCAVVFDLDGTLFDVSHRTLGIMREWLQSQEGKNCVPWIARKLQHMDLCHMGYSVSHAFENLGLDLRNQEVCKVLEQTEKHWRRHFFDGKSLVKFDLPMAGACAFVQKIADAGIQVCYLTGRDKAGMTSGTLKQLELNAFPTVKARLLLKESSSQDDHEFKEHAFAKISQEFEIIGNFENEYINLSGMVKGSPQAVHVIVDSQHSGRPVTPLAQKVMRIRDFA
jgi:HAD superfamily, subfamily IIIB (Acid phosphatase)